MEGSLVLGPQVPHVLENHLQHQEAQSESLKSAFGLL